MADLLGEDMAWAVPEHSRRRVDKAGRTIIDPSAPLEEREEARRVINNWRSAHGFPMNTMQMNLRHRARAADPDATIARRTKRLSSIESKLDRLKGIKLSNMQDIGGCRAVVSTIDQVDEVVDKCDKSKGLSPIIRRDNYVKNPKGSGYRSVHLIYKYQGAATDYNGLQVEVQIRSALQHAWATGVETVGTFIGQALKASQGEANWLRFFQLMSTELAIREGRPGVPNTPSDRAFLREELTLYESRLKVIERLNAYNSALQLIEHDTEFASDKSFFLLSLEVKTGTLTVTGYRARELARAEQHYASSEASDNTADAVLVQTESLNALRRAYPNYFADTTAFVQAVRRATK